MSALAAFLCKLKQHWRWQRKKSLFAGEKLTSPQLDGGCQSKGGCAFILSSSAVITGSRELLDLLPRRSQIQSSLAPRSSLVASRSHGCGANRSRFRIKGQEELVSQKLHAVSCTRTPAAVRAMDLPKTSLHISFAASVLCPSSLKLN